MQNHPMAITLNLTAKLPQFDNMGSIIIQYFRRLKRDLQFIKKSRETQIIVRVFLLLCLSVLLFIPVELNIVADSTMVLVRVPLKLISIALILGLVIVCILLCLETIGLLFGFDIQYANILYATLGEGLYPNEENNQQSLDKELEMQENQKEQKRMQT